MIIQNLKEVTYFLQYVLEVGFNQPLVRSFILMKPILIYYGFICRFQACIHVSPTNLRHNL